ncbi:HET-domain-containing protein [Xylaria sp. FL1042]|nr:HET-domain-containing protein [Xylaria sp. FL1042]
MIALSWYTMRLLNVHTRKLQEFIGDKTPPYAILSHTWGEDEVSFQDLADPKHKKKLGYKKIQGCCQQAIRDGFEFVWVDTCCIDKRSSAELSEAINSMFRWYGEAQVCYVYLVDVPPEENSNDPHSAFFNSRWFTRGWTLQELIAPDKLKFFYRTWNTIFEFTKSMGRYDHLRPRRSTWFESAIARITGIEDWNIYSIYTIDTTLKDVPVATKLSWVAGRSTTRTEDIAYCLLGLLDVNMPLLYGEGYRAFLRLQEEFLKKSFDSSILLWGFGLDRSDIRNIGVGVHPNYLAPTPRLFQGFRNVSISRQHQLLGKSSGETWTVTPYGLRVDLPVSLVDRQSDAYICMTDYTITGSDRGVFAIPLIYQQVSDVYVLAPHSTPYLLNMASRSNRLKRKPIHINVDKSYYERVYFLASSVLPNRSQEWKSVIVDIDSLIEKGFSLDSIFPRAPSAYLSWVFHGYTEHIALVLVHRKQQVALYVYINCSNIHKWYRIKESKCKAQVCFSPYNKRRTAIEVWDSCRKARERSFYHHAQLNWQETARIEIGTPAQRRIARIAEQRLEKKDSVVD